MSEQDLSLLTDEERNVHAGVIEAVFSPQEVRSHYFDTLRALIAARAELATLRQEDIDFDPAKYKGNDLTPREKAATLRLAHAADDGLLLGKALVSARAENKRKDEVIAKLIDAAEQGRNLLRQMAEVSSLAGRRAAHERADAIDAVLKEAAALLQSEKGDAE